MPPTPMKGPIGFVGSAPEADFKAPSSPNNGLWMLRQTFLDTLDANFYMIKPVLGGYEPVEYNFAHDNLQTGTASSVYNNIKTAVAALLTAYPTTQVLLVADSLAVAPTVAAAGALPVVAAKLPADITVIPANLTGVTDDAIKLAQKRLDALLAKHPSVTKVYVVYNCQDYTNYNGPYLQWKALVCPSTCSLINTPIVDKQTVEDVLKTIVPADNEALIMLPDALTTRDKGNTITKFVHKYKTTPCMFGARDFVKIKGPATNVMSLDCDRFEMMRKATEYAIAIANGTKTVAMCPVIPETVVTQLP
jgi:ABC-type uncharacterized transport system substrate-binding protein